MGSELRTGCIKQGVPPFGRKLLESWVRHEVQTLGSTDQSNATFRVLPRQCPPRTGGSCTVPRMSAYSGVSLPDATPEAMLAAIAAVLETRTEAPLAGGDDARLPTTAERFRTSAANAVQDGFFLASLEAAYLVAAADGVDARERAALGDLVRRITGLDLDSEILAEQFATFDAAAKATSRAARLEAVAMRLGGFVEREEALGFAALVAMADHHFARKEARALIELGEAFGFSVGEVQALLDGLAAAIREALTG